MNEEHIKDIETWTTTMDDGLWKMTHTPMFWLDSQHTHMDILLERIRNWVPGTELDLSNTQRLNVHLLPPLPSTLTHLNCSSSQLNTLPSLPATLTHLDCSDNVFSVLPFFPATLIHLDCSYNRLQFIRPLPATLTHLICHKNQLAWLPPLPDTLTHLKLFRE